MVEKYPLRFCTFFIILFFSIYSSADNLVSRFYKEQAQPRSTISTQLLKQLKNKHVVFIDGVANELATLAGNYFSDNRAALERLGVSSSHLSPSSGISIRDNGDVLYEELMKIHEETQQAIIVIAHSKGGAEALLALLNHPKLIASDWLEKVVLIQAAIGGSDLIDHINPLFYYGPLGLVYAPGLDSLSPYTAKRVVQDAFKYFHSQVSRQSKFLVSRKVYYVRGVYDGKEKLSLGLELALAVCTTTLDSSSQNDGILKTSDQMPPSKYAFGTDLGVLNADHIELVVSGIFARSDAPVRHAFTRALLSQIFSSS